MAGESDATQRDKEELKTSIPTLGSGPRGEFKKNVFVCSRRIL